MSNAADKNNMTHTSEDVQRKMNSIYGSLQMNWDGWLFMDITARNDWSSTMSKENQSYFILRLAYLVLFQIWWKRLAVQCRNG